MLGSFDLDLGDTQRARWSDLALLDFRVPARAAACRSCDGGSARRVEAAAALFTSPSLDACTRRCRCRRRSCAPALAHPPSSAQKQATKSDSSSLLLGRRSTVSGSRYPVAGDVGAFARSHVSFVSKLSNVPVIECGGPDKRVCCHSTHERAATREGFKSPTPELGQQEDRHVNTRSHVERRSLLRISRRVISVRKWSSLPICGARRRVRRWRVSQRVDNGRCFLRRNASSLPFGPRGPWCREQKATPCSSLVPRRVGIVVCLTCR